MPNSHLKSSPPATKGPGLGAPMHPLLVTSFQRPRLQFSLLTLIVAATLLPPFTFLVVWFADGRIVVALAAFIPTITTMLTATLFSFFKPVYAFVAVGLSYLADTLLLGCLCFNTEVGHHFLQALGEQKAIGPSDYGVLLALLFGIGNMIGGFLGCGLSMSRNG